MKWLAYILRCADGSYYCGITTDLVRRVRQHNGQLAGGAKYTKGRRPVCPVFRMSFPTQAAAARKEWAWRTMSHEQKKRYDHSGR